MPTKKSKPTNKIKFIILNFGYVESAHPYNWIFEHNMGFNTKFDAAQNLAIEYKTIYLEKYPLEKIEECCAETHKNNDNFCKTCGKPKYRTLDLDPIADPYVEWLLDGSEQNYNDNDVSEHFSCYSAWNLTKPPYGITKENSLYISEAEKILTGLLYKTGLEDYLDEDIKQEIFCRTTFEKFKASFESIDGPNIYG